MRRNMLFAASLVALLSCNGSSAQCVVGADCASGACSADGQCIAAPGNGGDGGAGADASLPDGASPVSEGGGTLPDGAPQSGDGATSSCQVTGNGTIQEDQVPMGPPLRATYLDAQSVTWSTAGVAGDAGGLVWDLSGSLSGDQPVVFAAESPTGTWWTSAFAGASYASLLSASQTLLGVFELGGSSLSLIGVVSPTSGAQQTELTYATPIPTLQFPLSVGATWSATSNVTGQAEGVPAAYTESYVSKVDSAGTLKTPYASFPVLRVGTVLTRTVGVVPTVTRSYAWVAECIGIVATVTSQAGESSAEFSNDAEVRRLTP
jgi:hypothetical protein